MRRIERENTGTVRPGQDLVIAGYAGLSGTVETVKNKQEELYQWFSRDYVERILESGNMELEGDLEKWKEFGASECEPAGEGGVLKALWDGFIRRLYDGYPVFPSQDSGETGNH